MDTSVSRLIRTLNTQGVPCLVGGKDPGGRAAWSELALMMGEGAEGLGLSRGGLMTGMCSCGRFHYGKATCQLSSMSASENIPKPGPK